MCIGASTVTYASIERNGGSPQILESDAIIHDGNPEKVVNTILAKARVDGIDQLAVTGRKFRSMVDAATIPEPEAIERAYSFVRNGAPADLIVSAGGETVMVYLLDSNGRISDVATGNKCASGTGEFFLQQLKRMDIGLDEVSGIAEVDDPFPVSGRCSVFCKSDCTHALNKGVPRERVVAGLTDMMAGKIHELVHRISLSRGSEPAVILVGGSSKNKLMIDSLNKRISDLRVPPHASCFEALGASLWALDSSEAVVTAESAVINRPESSFSRLASLKNFSDQVEFRAANRRQAAPGEPCILGLDVGSTTTKAVLIPAGSIGPDREDTPILASVYLRTNGDPIGAARECYAGLLDQLSEDIDIVGLGTTGSGRQIAGLHALTPSIINEIVAHATAAAHYDEKVDTIFEVGGQDAKYTFLTNGVASDYAMNEACSAGTGSFLEEAAAESLNIKTEEIGDYALNSSEPTNFSDQCAAFINSDIKSAIQEGVGLEDIAAGLVYSICMNYSNRVKGSRAVGERIFMQGGVCYNRAVPAAMAALTGKRIIVPPEPGLMGAFGVALDVKSKIEIGLQEPLVFNLRELANRNVVYKDPFVCRGGREKCDRKCEINRIVIKGKIYPFGGACDRYYNQLRQREEFDVESLDLVEVREKLVFDKYAEGRLPSDHLPNGKTLGINRSLLSNTFYPLYYHFFSRLGYTVIHDAAVSEEGIDRRGSAFCYPAEVSHGVLESLLKRNPDILFMPYVKSVHLSNRTNVAVTCPVVHAETSYLRSAFTELETKTILSPVLDFSAGYGSQEAVFLDVGRSLGHPAGVVKTVYRSAVAVLEEMLSEFKEIGKKALERLEHDPGTIGIVLFGRPYNAFTKLGHKGIPHKFASRGYLVIPCDFLDYESQEDPEHVYWGAGEIIIKAAKLASRHPSLYGTYITNFSCGPDSFLIDYFRKEMGRKPSLTLELDNHTADVGVDTRIEAFIDVVKSYIELNRRQPMSGAEGFSIARATNTGNKIRIFDSNGKEHKLTDPRVHVLIPSMMDICSQAAGAVLRRSGIRASAVPDPTREEFTIGLGLTSGKECLPAAITTGSLIKYLRNRPDSDELLVYFVPGDSGPCRFGSYYVLMQNILEKLEIKDVALLSLSQEDGYMGLGSATTLRLWQSFMITDVLEEIYGSLLVLSKDLERAKVIFENATRRIIQSLEHDTWSGVERSLEACAEDLAGIEKKAGLDEVPMVSLINEMYVRRNHFARQNIVEKLADRGIILRVAGLHEWLFYVDYVVKKKLVQNATLGNRIRTHIETVPKRLYEKKIKRILAGSGLYEYRLVDIETIYNNAKDLIPETLICESILITGTAITDLIEDVSGIISIQPFGCMPGRVGEAVISRRLSEYKMTCAEQPELVKEVMKEFPFLPFLTLEVDGQVFTQGIEAKLEAFCLQVERLHKKTRAVANDLTAH
jgi:predicted CoA-substrate-specific enzyme activase